MILSRIACLLGLHGPDVFGHSFGPRNHRVGPGLRVCEHCGTRWFAYDAGPEGGGRRILAWERVPPHAPRARRPRNPRHPGREPWQDTVLVERRE